MKSTLESIYCANDPDFIGLWIRKEDMEFSVASAVKSEVQSKRNKMFKVNETHISESELEAFGITAEEWKMI
ncbi:hypothetical protein RclHR1_04800006 [Rhizophagus clarus]|uniref:Uncharacterized protein n=1 Tax=Rhizophagus clarus TaxID=94130 RepID=A0A2Z6RJC6_9GLOM|nr:hypothetical protein RclHR1_04800006 [Rhizophagus clarus]GES83211.1 hypothetical protein RCL_jg15922.t1 [Rhizophagus clarus]